MIAASIASTACLPEGIWSVSDEAGVATAARMSYRMVFSRMVARGQHRMAVRAARSPARRMAARVAAGRVAEGPAEDREAPAGSADSDPSVRQRAAIN